MWGCCQLCYDDLGCVEMNKWICELHKICKSTTCLDKQPHDEHSWCKKESRCAETRLKVKCIEVEE